jgi:hypothetical protein
MTRWFLLCTSLLFGACGDDSIAPDASPEPDGGPTADAPMMLDAGRDAGPTQDVGLERRDAGARDGGPVGVDAGPDLCPRVIVRVSAGNTLNVREASNSASAMVGSLGDGQIVTVVERVVGEAVMGNIEWFLIDSAGLRGYISGAFAECTTDAIPTLMPPAAYYLPLVCGQSARISQGNNGTTSHSGRSRFAFDFAIALNTPMVAMADAIVDEVFAETGPGDRCYDGGDEACFRFANYVALRHGDGTGSIYKHLNRVDVRVGDFVPAGSTIGLSGSTGYSTGPHAHVMRQALCGEPLRCESVAIVFADVPGDGVPDRGETVTSGNCP